MLCVSKLQLSGGESILDNSSQIDQLVTEKSELQSKAEQVRFSECSVKSNSEIFEKKNQISNNRNILIHMKKII